MTSHPKILEIHTLAQGKFFSLEHVDLQFGQKQVTFERINTRATNGAVFIIAHTDSHCVLIREYMTGTERYELSLPKGAIDSGETPIEAAKRELIEETGYRSVTLRLGRKTYANSAYMTSFNYYVFAEEITEGVAEGGDEVEPLEVVLWPLDDLPSLINSNEIGDARTLLGLYMLMQKNGEKRD